jgi:cytochrome c553
MKTAFTLSALFAVAAAHATDITPEATVERAAHVCAVCHGDSARNNSDAIPNIAGQMPLYTQAQLNDFRSQTRAETDVQAYMWGISALLDDDTITGLSEYFAAQSPAPGRSGKPKLVEEGRKIFVAGIPAKGIRACAGCHGANAEGASVFPRLAGQKAQYVLAQLRVFATRLRPHGVLMKNEAAGLSADQMRAVAEYVQSL